MACKAVYIRIILEELGHEQPPTPLQNDNAMVDRVVNWKVQPKQTKAMDMRFHWIRDQECQWQFQIYWQPDKLNYAYYWTKYYPKTHHQRLQKEFPTPHIVLKMSRIEHQIYAACAAWRSVHSDVTWQGCDDLSLARPDPWDKDRPQSQAPTIVVA